MTTPPPSRDSSRDRVLPAPMADRRWPLIQGEYEVYGGYCFGIAVYSFWDVLFLFLFLFPSSASALRTIIVTFMCLFSCYISIHCQQLPSA